MGWTLYLIAQQGRGGGGGLERDRLVKGGLDCETISLQPGINDSHNQFLSQSGVSLQLL